MARQRTDEGARRRARWTRWIILGTVLVGMSAVLLAHQKAHGPGRWAGVDFLCPFGGLETLYALLAGQGFLKHTAASSLILLIGMLAMTLVYRRSFCGTICPLGALQGIFGAAGRRLFGRRFEVPRGVDRVARYLKYVVLAVFAVWTWQAAELVLRPYDPWVAWAHLTSGDLLTTYLIGFIVLVVSLAGSLVYDRFFCKYLCPTGALLALFSRASVLRHPPQRRDLHRLRPLRPGLHDERGRGDRGRGHEPRVHLLQRVRQRLPRGRRPRGRRPERQARLRPRLHRRRRRRDGGRRRRHHRGRAVRLAAAGPGGGDGAEATAPAAAAGPSTSCRSRATRRSPRSQR